jgi:hypothetical protein
MTFQDSIIGQDFLLNLTPNSLNSYSIKHQALYTYLARLLRPIWELSIVSQPSLRSSRKLQSNMALFQPVYKKLGDFNDFLKLNTETFVGLKTQSKFLTEGTPLHEQLLMLNELDV